MPGPEGGTVCLGQTGAITRVRQGVQSRVVTGLPSLAGPSGMFASGPVDVGLRDAHDGDREHESDRGHDRDGERSRDGDAQLFALTGLGANPAVRTAPGMPSFAKWFGHLVRVHPAGGTWTDVADVSAFEASANPDQADPRSSVDSNPYGLLVTSRGWVVADTGGNDLLRVKAGGAVSLLSVFHTRSAPLPFPPFGTIPMQAVPTTVVEGPDDADYVGQLTGFPFPVGGANVYRVPRDGGTPTVFRSGFTNIVDIAFGPDESLYVLEITHNGLLSHDMTGALIRVRPNGTRETLLDPLIAPGGLAFAPDGSIYITNKSVFAGGGELLRFVP